MSPPARASPAATAMSAARGGAGVQRERERDAAAGERLARRQRRDLDAREVAEGVELRGGDEPRQQERHGHAQRQRVVERREQHHRRAWRSAPSRVASAAGRCASGAAPRTRGPTARGGTRAGASARASRRRGCRACAARGPSCRSPLTAAAPRAAATAPARRRRACRRPAVTGDRRKHRLHVLGQHHRTPCDHRVRACRRQQHETGARAQAAARAGVARAAVRPVAARRGEQCLHVIEQRGRDVDLGGLALPIGERGRIGERCGLADAGAAVAAGQEIALRRRVRIAELDRHQEAVELRFRQRVRADLLDRDSAWR